MKPASSMRCAAGAVSSASTERRLTSPAEVGMPASPIDSFTVHGTPRNGGRSGSPDATRASAASASASASANLSRARALVRGWARCRRHACASTTSRADSSPARIARARSVALRWVMGGMAPQSCIRRPRGRRMGKYPAVGGDRLTRRVLLGRAAAGAAGAAIGPRLPALGTAAGAARRIVPLPSPRQVRADFQRMVDFGPRLTGSPGHDRFVDWLRREFVAAGADLLPCDDYAYERWSAGSFGLDLLDGTAPGPVKVASYYTRSQETPAAGIEGPLVYGGTMPRNPADVASWAQALPGTVGGGPQGSILLVDLPFPAPLTAAAFLPLATYLHWPGHSEVDWARIDYSRTWIMPGLGVPLAPFQAIGAAGVVFVVDRSYETLAGNYLPFDHGHEPLPALYVDRDTGRDLRAQAAGRPRTRLTLMATRTKVTCPSVTAVLPGESEECLILNTHTDGQGFVEENGGVAFVQLARHFASLPRGQRLKRTLVFAAWPGHMSGALPELEGWMGAHPDLVKRAAAAMTIEHLGCSEWIETEDKGYHATGENELLGVWTTRGKMCEVTRDALIAAALPRPARLRPPVQFGVGGAFQSAGVPQIGAIAGPEYLLTITPNGDMDELDERLAAKQIAWLADIARRIDGITAAELRAGDPTLGSDAPSGDVSTPRECRPPELRVSARVRRKRGRVVVSISADGQLDGVVVELRRGARVVARSRLGQVGSATRNAAFHRKRPAARYTLVVRSGNRLLLRRPVRLGRAR